MEITYTTGAKVILQGPATYEADSNAGGYLLLGKLTARLEKAEKVASGQRLAAGKSEIRNQKSEISNPQSLIPNPPSALRRVPLAKPVPPSAFTVRTPTATVTDLGTEFGVTVSEQGRTQVHVLQGVVEARRIGPEGREEYCQRLTEGAAVEIGAKNEPIKPVAFAPRSFARKLAAPPIDNPVESAYVAAVLADKPMGYWPLNEPTGARRFFDCSGNGIHGYAMHNVTAGQPGPLSDDSRAIEFDGGGYIDLGYHPEFAMENDFTVEAWVWIGPVKRNSMVFAVHGAGEYPIGWGLSAGGFGSEKDAEGPGMLRFEVFRVKNFEFPVPRDPAVVGRWLHVAVVYDDAGAAHLYLDGKLSGTIAGGLPVLQGPAWLTIGCAEQTGPAESIDIARWRGRLSHIAVYPRALSAQQIKNHYRQCTGGKEAPDKQP